MGFFIYDSSREVAVDDRTLVHLQVVIIDKFRRNERFAMTLLDQKRFVTVWMTPQSPLQFVYEGNRRPTLNRVWLDQLSDTSAMTGMLQLIPEPLNPELHFAGSDRGSTQ